MAVADWQEQIKNGYGLMMVRLKTNMDSITVG